MDWIPNSIRRCGKQRHLAGRICPFRMRILAVALATLFIARAVGAVTLTPYLVRDINSGGGSSNLGSVIVVKGEAFFTADDGVHGSELWKCDGTAAGTYLVKDINFDSAPSNISELTDVGGTAFFSADDGSGGIELWRSDGTPAGTTLIRDIRPGGGIGNSRPISLTDWNGTVFFQAEDGVHGEELWKSDGTELGTELVKDILSGGSSGNAQEMTVLKGEMLFSANDGISHGVELWITDGTEAGTRLLRDIRAGEGSSFPTYLTRVNDTVFFRANEGIGSGTELWKSNGTDEETMLVKDIRPGSSSSSIEALVEMGGNLFFRANDGTNGSELWQSDGSEDGTLLVMDISPGNGASFPAALTAVESTLYFTATDGVNGRELWRSDGTEAGTEMVIDLSPGADSTFSGTTNELVAANQLLFFPAAVRNGDLWDHRLYVSDGTAIGTSALFTVPGIESPTLLISELIFTGTHLLFRAPLDVSELGTASNFELFAIAIDSNDLLPGDYDSNGVIDAGDYTVWRDSLGAAAGTLPNDVDGGPIGIAQYNTWRANFGNTFVGSSVENSTVPECTSLLSFATGVMGGSIAIARRRNH